MSDPIYSGRESKLILACIILSVATISLGLGLWYTHLDYEEKVVEISNLNYEIGDLNWANTKYREKIKKLEQEVAELRETEYYQELWVGKSPKNKFMVYLDLNGTITVLKEEKTNADALHWALEHAGPDAIIYLEYRRFENTILLGNTEWSVTIK